MAAITAQAKGARAAVAAKKAAEKKARALEAANDGLEAQMFLASEQVAVVSDALRRERRLLLAVRRWAETTATRYRAELAQLQKEVGSLDLKLWKATTALSVPSAPSAPSGPSSSSASDRLEIRSLKEQLAKAQEAASASQKELNELKNRPGPDEEHRSRIESLSAELSAATNSSSAASRDLAQAKKDILSFVTDLSNTQHAVLTTGQELAQSKEEVVSLTSKLSTAENVALSATNELAQAKKELASLKAAYDQTCTTLGLCDQARLQALASAEELRKYNEQGAKELRRHQGSSENAGQKLEQLAKDHQHAQHQLSDVVQRFETGKKQYFELRQKAEATTAELEELKKKHDAETELNRDSRQMHDVLVKDHERKTFELNAREMAFKDLQFRFKGLEEASKIVGLKLNAAESALRAKDRELSELRLSQTQSEDHHMEVESPNTNVASPKGPLTPTPSTSSSSPSTVRPPTTASRPSTPLSRRQGDSPFPSSNTARDPMFLVQMERRARNEIEAKQKKLEAEHKELAAKHIQQEAIAQQQATQRKELEAWNQQLQEEKTKLEKEKKQVEEAKDELAVELAMFKVYHEEDVEEVAEKAKQQVAEAAEQLEQMDLNYKVVAGQAETLKLQYDLVKSAKPELEEMKRKMREQETGEKEPLSPKKKRVASASAEDPNANRGEKRALLEENSDGMGTSLVVSSTTATPQDVDDQTTTMPSSPKKRERE